MRVRFLPVAVAVALLIAGCENGNPVGPAVATGLKLYAATGGPSVMNVTDGRVNTSPGEEFQFFARVRLDNDDEADVSSHVQWGTSDSAVITVSETGLVTTVGEGEAQVIATFLEHAAVTTFGVQIE